MKFNLDTARNEMENFWEVLFNPNAVSKFIHTVSSGYVLASLFVVGVSSWYLLKRRDILFAKRSMVVGASFGLITSIYLIISGDESAYNVAQNQPMKLAVMEGLYKGEEGAGIVAIGLLNHKKEIGDKREPFYFKIEIPNALSLLGYRNSSAFVPGVEDLLYGNREYNILSIEKKIVLGKEAIEALREYKEAKREGNTTKATIALDKFREYEKYMGYGYLKSLEDAVPNIPINFYSFHLMVWLGIWFLILFGLSLFFLLKRDILKHRWLLWAMVFSIPLGYVAQEAGWIVAEVGRQPWAIQDFLPVGMATSNIASSSVMVTFWLFAILFTTLLVAEIKIMLKQISIGVEGESRDV